MLRLVQYCSMKENPPSSHPVVNRESWGEFGTSVNVCWDMNAKNRKLVMILFFRLHRRCRERAEFIQRFFTNKKRRRRRWRNERPCESRQDDPPTVLTTCFNTIFEPDWRLLGGDDGMFVIFTMLMCRVDSFTRLDTDTHNNSTNRYSIVCGLFTEHTPNRMKSEWSELFNFDEEDQLVMRSTAADHADAMSEYLWHSIFESELGGCVIQSRSYHLTHVKWRDTFKNNQIKLRNRERKGRRTKQASDQNMPIIVWWWFSSHVRNCVIIIHSVCDYATIQIFD